MSQDDEAGPSVSELAEQIKALKAAHSIEATPQRVRQKQSTAEEPVTARIRRRTERLLVRYIATSAGQTCRRNRRRIHPTSRRRRSRNASRRSGNARTTGQARRESAIRNSWVKLPSLPPRHRNNGAHNDRPVDSSFVIQ